MKMQLIGFFHKAGQFVDPETKENVEFDSISLEIIADTPPDNEYVQACGGMHCNILKIKTYEFNRLFPPEILKPDDLVSWFGKEIRIEYSLVNSKPVISGIRLAK